jgi:hypothetical protein
MRLVDRVALVTGASRGIGRAIAIIYHGVLAPNARVRAAVVAFGVPAAVTPAPNATHVSRETGIPGEHGTAEPDAVRRGWTWAQLMRRAFDLYVQVCPNCGGRLRLPCYIKRGPEQRATGRRGQGLSALSRGGVRVRALCHLRSPLKLQGEFRGIAVGE